MAETVTEYDPNERRAYSRTKKTGKDAEDAVFKAEAGGMAAGSGLGKQDASFADDPMPTINDKGIEGDAAKLGSATVQWRKRRAAKKEASTGTALKKALADSPTVKAMVAGK